MTVDNSRVIKALVRMGIARQSPPDEAALIVYAEELNGIDPGVIEAACHRLSRRPRADFETAFPSLGALLLTCEQVTADHALDRIRAIAETCPKQLEPPAELPAMTKHEAKTKWREMYDAMLAMRRRTS